jgi:hypothetical protein
MSIKAFGTLRSSGINDKFNKAVKLINAEVVEAEQAENFLTQLLQIWNLQTNSKAMIL